MRKLAACLLILTGSAHGESSPSDVAVGHLLRIAENRLELESDTALTAGTTREKKASISDQLAKLSEILGAGSLRPLEEKSEGDLAAVLVSSTIDYDPERVQVLAVPLLRKDGRWVPAPVLSSFENTGISYVHGVSDAAKRLEAWMLRERGEQVRRLRDNVQADLFEDIAKVGNADELRSADPGMLVLGFIEACRQRDLPAMLYHLGGLEEPLPEDWKQSFRFATAQVRDNSPPSRAWQQMTDTTNARAIVGIDRHGDGATVSLGEFDPFDDPPGISSIRILHFPLHRSKSGSWRLGLPTWLVDGNPVGKADPIDSELVEALPASLVKAHPPESFASPGSLADSLRDALAGDRFEAVLPHIRQDGEDALAALQRAAGLWREFRRRDSEIPLLLDVSAQGDDACLLMSHFDARNPEIRGKLIQRVLLQARGGEWAVPIGPVDTNNAPQEELAAWAEGAVKLGEDEWLDRLGIARFPADAIPADAPTAEQARAAAEGWLDAIRSRDPKAIFGTAAAFDDKRATRKLLRNIGHELQADHHAEILKVHRKGRWAAVSTRVKAIESDSDSTFMLYPVITTDDGPRIVAEAILYHSDSRSREFLNESVWTRLENLLSGASVAELKELHAAHDTLADESAP